MSEAQGENATGGQAAPGTETAEAKAKRTRTTWPIRIFTVDSVSPLKLTLVSKAPEYSDAEKAAHWIRDNGDPNFTYVPVRVGPGLSPTVGLKEHTLFKAPAVPAAAPPATT